MFTVSCNTIGVLFVLFIIFLAHAYIEDMKYIESIEFTRHNEPKDSKVKKMLTSARDQIIRGAIMGGVEGSAIIALQSAITWSLTGGIMSGISEVFGWRTYF